MASARSADGVIPANEGGFDFESFRLRSFAAELEAIGELERSNCSRLSEVAAAIDGNARAVIFEGLSGVDHPLIGNVMGTRARLARAFGVGPNMLNREIIKRLESNGEVLEVPQNMAPAQEIVQLGDEVDLMQLPVHLQHAKDGGPFISAGLDFSRDPDSGRPNVGVRRLMLRSRNTLHISIFTSELSRFCERAKERGEHLPLSIVVGSHPIDYYAGSMAGRGDELELISRLRQAPVPVVKCRTSDIRVPADAEWVLEGYVGHDIEPEGPFGEFLGYYGPMSDLWPVFHVTAVTRRRDALFQTISISGATLQYTDTSHLMSTAMEVDVWRALSLAGVDVEAVYVTPTSGLFNARISLRQHKPGAARAAILAALSVRHIKTVFVTDPDIDIYSHDQMDWAFASRFQGDRDTIVVSGVAAVPGHSDPSLPYEAAVGAKTGFDLTLPYGREIPLGEIPVPPVLGPRRSASVREALADGPKYFAELMSALGIEDGRDIALMLNELREEGSLTREPLTGRYALRPGD